MAIDYTFFAFFIENQIGKTGLTVTVDVRNVSTGSLVVNNQSATEIGSGFYKYTYSATSGDYVAVFKTATTTVDLMHFPDWAVQRIVQNPTVDEIIAGIPDPLTNTVPGSYQSGTAGRALGMLGTTYIVDVVQPVLTTGEILLRTGDSYYAVDGRSFDFSSTSWPDLTGATDVKFKCKSVSINASVIASGTGSQTVRVEFTKANVDTIKASGATRYEIDATLANTHPITLVASTMTVENGL